MQSAPMYCSKILISKFSGFFVSDVQIRVEAARCVFRPERYYEGYHR